MKKVILYLTILIFGVNIAFGSLEDGLVAYYTFDGNADDSVNNNDGTVNGATLTTGKIGQAYDFDGINDYIDTSLEAIYDDFSINLWFKALTQSTTSVLIGSQENSGNYRILLKLLDTGEIQMNNERVNTHPEIITSNHLFDDNSWHNVVIVSNMANISYLYVDGILEGTLNSPVNKIYLDNEALFIGSRNFYGTPDFFFNGTIDEIGIWNYSLTEDEIELLYNEGNGLQYPFITSGNLSISQANAIIDEVFNEEFTNPIILNNQKVYTSFISGITEERIYNRYIIADNKRYAIYYGNEPSNNINQDNTFYSLELEPQTETNLRDALDDLIN